MTGVLVIGCGNPLRGDDGLGPYAAQRLAGIVRRDAVRVIACHQLTPELAEPVSQADRVIFVDAACDSEAGLITCRPVEPPNEVAAFTHVLDAAALLRLAEVLYGRRPAALLLTVGAQSFGYEERFSPPVSAALPAVLERLYDLTADPTDIEA